MKKQTSRKTIKQFSTEQLKKEVFIKGGPVTSRGTETTVQQGGN